MCDNITALIHSCFEILLLIAGSRSHTFCHHRKLASMGTPDDDLSDYQLLPYHIVHDVKVDGRYKSRLVVGVGTEVMLMVRRRFGERRETTRN